MNYTKPEVTVLGDAGRVIEQVTPHKPAAANDGLIGSNPAYDLDE
jgi:hypothetical protein